MPKKIKYLLIFLLLFVIGTNGVLAKTFSSDNVITACGFDTLSEKIPVITSTLYNLAKIVAPIVLIVMAMVDLTNAVMSSDEQKMKKNQKKIITRFLAAVIIFLVMAIVQFIFTNVDSGKTADFNNCMNCLLSNKGCGAARSNKPEYSEYIPNNNFMAKMIVSAYEKVIDHANDVLRSKGITECEYCNKKITSQLRMNCLLRCGCNHYTTQSDCDTQTGNTCTWNGSKCVPTSLQSSSSNSNQTTPSNSSGDNNVVTYATKFVGHPYVWGGNVLCEDWNSNSGCGVDCSGFVQNVYGNLGYDKNCIGRTTTTQASQLGAQPYTDESSLQKGDLIFFYSGLSHVGIYIGNGEYVHASNKKTGVKISKLADSQPVKWARVSDKCSKS